MTRSNTLENRTRWMLASAPICGMATAGLAASAMPPDEIALIPTAAALAGIGITAVPGMVLAASRLAGLLGMQRGILARRDLFNIILLGYMIANGIMFPLAWALWTANGHSTPPAESALAIAALPICGISAWIILRRTRSQDRTNTQKEQGPE